MFSKLSEGYANICKWLLRLTVIVLIVYAGLLLVTYKVMTTTPQGFVPPQDKGYLIVDVQLPDSASMERTQAVVELINKIALGKRVGDASRLVDKPDDAHHETHESHASEPWDDANGIEGVDHTLVAVGFSFVQLVASSNFATVFIVLDPFHERGTAETYSDYIADELRKQGGELVEDARLLVLGPPPVDGLGTGGGFKVMLRDLGGAGLSELQNVTLEASAEGSKKPEILGMQTGFRANTPQMFVDVDREKCKNMNVPLSEVFTALQAYLGGYYVNDFNAFGRTWQVNIQADPDFRVSPEQVTNLYVRSTTGKMVPLHSVARVVDSTGPAMVVRYNGFNAASINGLSPPGISSGDMIKAVESTMGEQLPFGFDFQWTELTFMQIRAGNTSSIVFAIAVILVFLVLAAQYESLKLPLAVILVVPMCLLCSVLGVAWAGMDINIFVQIGFVVLVGLASKNAILIVEFAKEQQLEGMNKFDATIEACRLRLRPIIMTSLAFILGVVPLVISTGAGAEMRRTLGTAVFSGMLGVTFFGVFLTPVFFYAIATPTDKLASEDSGMPVDQGGHPVQSADPHAENDG